MSITNNHWPFSLARLGYVGLSPDLKIPILTLATAGCNMLGRGHSLISQTPGSTSLIYSWERHHNGQVNGVLIPPEPSAGRTVVSD